MVDPITSPYIDDSGERIYSKFDQRDYKPLRTRSFKPHLCCLEGPQYITPSVQWIYQCPCALLLHVFGDQMRGKRAERTGGSGVVEVKSLWIGFYDDQRLCDNPGTICGETYACRSRTVNHERKSQVSLLHDMLFLLFFPLRKLFPIYCMYIVCVCFFFFFWWFSSKS